jgi:hypothetical protein
MKFSVLCLSALSLVAADNVRRLSFESVAGYAPGSQVTDHCALDLDQKAMESELSKATDQSFAKAKEIYNDGAHSKSYAKITLSAGLPASVNKGQAATGVDGSGNEVAGKMYATYQAGDTEVRFQYRTGDQQSTYVNCQVGALGSAGNLEGCLAAAGSIKIDGTDYAYTYTPATDNDNGRSISGFSLQAEAKMAKYQDFKWFKEYYGVGDYGHQWVTAAFDGGKTEFTNGNADFSVYEAVGKTECIKKGTVYFNIFMYVIREYEDAIDDCQAGCQTCNDDPVHAWDEGVCFYTGSLEGQQGTSDGKLLHQLADKRCANFKTCGENGDSLSGISKLNIDLFSKLNLGKSQLAEGKCDAAKVTTAEVIKMMYIPLIQGALRYAYKVGTLNEGEKSQAEAAVFAAALLPRVHAASPSAATTIYNSMKTGATSTDAAAVKAAFESVYEDMGITCEDIGGLWNEGQSAYYEGMAPCGQEKDSASASNTLAVAAAVGAAALML